MPGGIRVGQLRGNRVARPSEIVREPAQRLGSGGVIWAVTPCKGRLSFLQRSSERVMGHPDARYCVVDYSCPDQVGAWVEQRFARQLQDGRVAVERVANEPGFNKCRAHNAGARRASNEGAEYLCFIDADTLVEPGFWGYIRERARPDRFLIAGLRDDGSDMPSMTGLLVVHSRAFESVGGFDEQFAGWGGEDIELRLRLFLLGGLDFEDVPLTLAGPIPHGNNLRTQFYGEHSIAISNNANMQRVHRKLAYDWRGRMVRSPSDAARLWFQHSADPCRDDPDDEWKSTQASEPQRSGPRRDAPVVSYGPERRDRPVSRRLLAASAHLHREPRS